MAALAKHSFAILRIRPWLVVLALSLLISLWSPAGAGRPQAALAEDPAAALAVDLGVTKSDSPDPVAVNTALTYTVVVSNRGTDPASNVSLTDSLPTSVQFSSATATQGTCSFNQGTMTVTCPIGGIDASSAVTATIVVTPTMTGQITNRASVMASEQDTNFANNMDTEMTQVVNADVDLVLTILDSSDPVGLGWPLTYTLSISNAGSSMATGVTLTANLPQPAELIATEPSQGNCSAMGGTVTCPLGTIAAGGGETVEIAIRPLAVGEHTLTAQVKANEGDTDPPTNTASEITFVIGAYLPLVVRE